MIQIKFCIWHNLWYFETHKHLLPGIKWFTIRKRSTQGPCSTNYSLSLSLSLTQMNAQNILSRKVFSRKFSFHEWETMNLYTLVNRHTIQIITVVHRLTDSNKIIKKLLFEQEGLVHICQNPTQCPVHKYINSYTISFFSYVELRIFTTFNNIFKWIY